MKDTQRFGSSTTPQHDNVRCCPLEKDKLSWQFWKKKSVEASTQDTTDLAGHCHRHDYNDVKIQTLYFLYVEIQAQHWVRKPVRRLGA